MANVIINDTNLTNIANAIREKNGTSDKYKPNQMAGAILAIQAGGGGGDFLWPDNILMSAATISANGSLDWLWSQLTKSVEIDNTTGINGAFSNSSLVDLSKMYIVLNNAGNINGFFSNCTYLTKLPTLLILAGGVGNVVNFFQNCNNLRTIPDDFFMKKDRTTHVSTGELGFQDKVRLANMFSGCWSLRKHPILWEGINRTGNSASTVYTGMFNQCYVLDEIVNIPVFTLTATSNMFSQTFLQCSRAKRITFAKYADGTPYTANWSKQTIDLSSYVGYTNYAPRITDHNSGIDGSTIINRLDQWNERKDNPDAWCLCESGEWSLYNHDSAVETIKSLPDCSAGSGNTIVFLGNSALSTGNPISKLTEEEIAVATAKGWTVSLA